jgi:hypothetical protein
VQIFLLIFGLLQEPVTQSVAVPSVRGDRFQIMVPQGWKTLNDGGFVLLQHSSGASLLVQRIDRTNNLNDYARRQAERIMMPLGFAKLGEPRQFKDTRDEWVQYEIVGNRLSDPHRILYRVLRRETGFYESIYEANEGGFDLLLTEAQGITSSVQALIEAPRPRPRRTR